MSGNNSKTNKTLTELATEYMQEYYSSFSTFGENHPKTKLSFACWQALKNVTTGIRDAKALTVVPPPLPEVQQQKHLFRSLIDWAKNLILKFRLK